MKILKDLFAFTHCYLLTYKTLRNQNTSKIFAICFFSDVNKQLPQIYYLALKYVKSICYFPSKVNKTGFYECLFFLNFKYLKYTFLNPTKE